MQCQSRHLGIQKFKQQTNIWTKKDFIMKTTSPTHLLSGGKTITLIVRHLLLRYLA